MKAISIACLAALFLLLFINVVARTLQLAGFAWFDEIVQGLFAWMVFVGAAALWRENDHFQVLWLDQSLAEGPARALRLLVAGLALIFLLAMTGYGAALTLKARALTPILDIPTSLFYAAIPVSGAIMVAYAITRIYRLTTRRDTPS